MMKSLMRPGAASADAELVNASLAGDRDAFGQIVARYQSLVCSLAYSATGSLTLSEDLAQETFLAAWKHLAELREPAKLRAWLCGIAQNLINNLLRKQGREPSCGAEPLEEMPEAHSPEALPVERAISREEAEILWRSLERIPETYRVPLVLFYREHQSVEAVARNLELTEDAVKQRLSRGRKLLEEEVQAFVEVALEKTSPGKAFTVAVVSALPLTTTTAQAASLGTAAAKSGLGLKSVSWAAGLGGLLGILGAILFSWKTAVDETRSRRERRFMQRVAWCQVGFFIVSMGAGFYWMPKLMDRPLAFGIGLAALILANIANGFVLVTYVVQRQMQIGLEEGTLADALPIGPEQDERRKAVRRAVKLTIPFLILLGVTIVYLPWKQHWARCAVVVATNVLVILWAFRRQVKIHSFQYRPRLQNIFLRHPFIALLVALAIPVVLAPLLSHFLIGFLHPEWRKPGVPLGFGLNSLAVSLLAIALVCAVGVLIFAAKSRLFPGLGSVFGRLAPNLDKALRPKEIINQTHGPLFRELNLTADQIERLKDLILKSTMVGVTKSMSLMKRKLDPARRAALMEELRSEREACDRQIKELLGEEHYQVLCRYDKTVPDRTMIRSFSGKWAGTPAAMDPQQAEQLLHGLIETRAQFNWTTDLSRRPRFPGDYAVVFNDENLATFAREEAEFERQFAIRAEQILSPDQFAAFRQFQAKHLQSQITQMKMGARLFRKHLDT